MAADSWSILSNAHALGDVRIGALSSSDGSEKWDYSKHAGYYDGDDVLYNGDDDSESPRGYAACSLDNYGYCGRCPH